MTLMERISQDLTSAMRAREAQRLAALRMAKAALMNREVEKGRALDESEEQQVVVSLIKQRRDSIEQFRQGGRQERADSEAIAEAGATSPKDLGKVMKAVMPKLAGRAVDGRTINELVRRKLGA